MRSEYVILICLAVSCALVTTVLAEDASHPPLPQFFNGSVADNLGNPAPVGTEIAAYINGEERGSIVMTRIGAYGWVDPGEPTLVVVGDRSGQTITFYVNGILAEQDTQFASGEVTRMNLTTKEAIPVITPTVTPTPAPTSTPGGGGGGLSPAPSGGTGGGIIFSGASLETSGSDTQPSNVTETPEITPTETVTIQPEETATTPVTTGIETAAPIGEVPMLAIIGVVVLAVAAVGGIFFMRRR